MKRRPAALFCFALIFLLPNPFLLAAPALNMEKANKMLAQAMEEKRYEDAAALGLRLIEENPRAPAYYLITAKALFVLGQFERARAVVLWGLSRRLREPGLFFMAAQFSFLFQQYDAADYFLRIYESIAISKDENFFEETGSSERNE